MYELIEIVVIDAQKNLLEKVKQFVEEFRFS